MFARRILLSNLCESATAVLFKLLNDTLSQGRSLRLKSKLHGQLVITDLFIVKVTNLPESETFSVVRTYDDINARNGRLSIQPSDKKTIGAPRGHVWVAGRTSCGKFVNMDPTLEQFDVTVTGRSVPWLWFGESLCDSGVGIFDGKATNIKTYHSSCFRVKEMLHSWTISDKAVDERGLNPQPLMKTLEKLVQC